MAIPTAITTSSRPTASHQGSGSVEANQIQNVTIDGAGLASGTYVVRVNGERFTDALSVTLLK